jgi:uncharacterized protein (TIGR02145 family)
MKTVTRLILLSGLPVLITFCSKPVLPVVSTGDPTEVTSNSAKISCQLVDDGGAEISEFGIAWNIVDYFPPDGQKITATSPGSFTATFIELLPGTRYYAKAYAVNTAGVGYGNLVSFTTLGGKPIVKTLSASDIQLSSAIIKGTVNPNNLLTSVAFEYGLTISYGNTLVINDFSSQSGTETEISATVSDLEPGKTYHYRLKAANSMGVSYSYDMTFTTLGAFVDSLKVEDVQMNSALLVGIVNPRSYSAQVEFEWGETAGYGNKIVIPESPLSGNSYNTVSTMLTGLPQGTTFHFRIVAITSAGETVSNDYTFKTLEPVYDIEGHAYNIMTFGKDVWMVENLRTKKYADGTVINYGLYYPANLISNVPVYGYLYDWAAAINQPPKYDSVMIDLSGQKVRGVCPTGWHLPTVEEWLDLINLYGGMETAGLKLKNPDLTLWSAPLVYELPASGFDVVAAGQKILNDGYVSTGFEAYYWTSSQAWTYGTTLMGRQIYFQNDKPEVSIQIFNDPGSVGVSVRCVKD